MKTTNIMSDLDDPKGLILASLALGFCHKDTDVNLKPTHYKLVAIGGPLLVRWPNGQWYEVSVREIEQQEDIEDDRSQTNTKNRY